MNRAVSAKAGSAPKTSCGARALLRPRGDDHSGTRSRGRPRPEGRTPPLVLPRAP
jgi:hypothetical protein